MLIGIRSCTTRLTEVMKNHGKHFWMGMPEDSELWDLLTRRPPEDMRQLIRRIEEYKWLEDD